MWHVLVAILSFLLDRERKSRLLGGRGAELAGRSQRCISTAAGRRGDERTTKGRSGWRGGGQCHHEVPWNSIKKVCGLDRGTTQKCSVPFPYSKPTFLRHSEDLALRADLGPPGLEHPAMDGLRAEVR